MHEDPEYTKELEEIAKSYLDGVKDGYQADMPNFSGKTDEMMAFFTLGIVDGIDARRHKFPCFTKPDWMTDAQLGAAIRLYLREKTILPSFPEFCTRIVQYHDYCGLWWNGMFLGIEKDGYTHS